MNVTWHQSDREEIEALAHAAGFDLAGVAAVPGGVAGEHEDARFRAWAEAGLAGPLEYLTEKDANGEYIRGDLTRWWPWARSVIVCAANYNADAPLSIDAAAPSQGWIARYAWAGRSGDDDGKGADYHDVLLPMLQHVSAQLRERYDGLKTWSYVDTGPVLERSYAARAGLGWIGRNTCVLNKEHGSWLLLGCIVTSAVLEETSWSVATPDLCGTCTRCVDACPTHALLESGTGQRMMDASRCIATLTIETKADIPLEHREAIGRQVFGCDICQDVCPWNRRSPVHAGPLPARRALINPELEWLAAMDGPEFNRWFRGTPLERTRRRRILRNVAIAMGNSGEQRFTTQLRAWEACDDDVLAEAAHWALERLKSREQW